MHHFTSSIGGWPAQGANPSLTREKKQKNPLILTLRDA